MKRSQMPRWYRERCQHTGAVMLSTPLGPYRHFCPTCGANLPLPKP